MKKITGNILKKNLSKTLGVHKELIKIVRNNSTGWIVYVDNYKMPVMWSIPKQNSEYTKEQFQEASNLFLNKLKGQIVIHTTYRIGIGSKSTVIHIDYLLEKHQLQYKLELLKSIN